MNTYSIFDTSILSYNIGNEIIMDAVMQNLNCLFSNDFFIRLPIEDIGKRSRRYNALSKYTFVGGTNALNGNIRTYRQWDLSLHNILMLKNVVLMGCGWFQYEHRSPSYFTKWAFSKILSKNVIHSVRDGYTLRKCEGMGLRGIKFINTGCPTLWHLDTNCISQIPRQKSDKVVFTITDYNKNIRRDTELLQRIKANYGTIYFFPQGSGDVDYLETLTDVKNIHIIPPRLRFFDSILDNGADYVGTRLHAGIRALQRKRRSFIIGIDNRAIEMASDFRIPVLNEECISDLNEWIHTPYSLNLNIPWDNIRIWKEQFKQQ